MDTSQLYLRILKGIIIVNIVEIIILLLIGKLNISFLLGLFLGSLISILMLRILMLSINKAMYLPPVLAQKYTLGRYFIRLFIYGITIFISLKLEYLNVVGTLIGLVSPNLSVKLGLLIDIISQKKSPKKI